MVQGIVGDAGAEIELLPGLAGAAAQGTAGAGHPAEQVEERVVQELERRALDKPAIVEDRSPPSSSRMAAIRSAISSSAASQLIRRHPAPSFYSGVTTRSGL